MTHGELQLAAVLLSEAADKFSNHVCNDLSDAAKNTITQGEWDILNKEYLERNGTPEEYEAGKILSYDWLWMRHLAHKLKMHTEADTNNNALKFLREEIVAKDNNRRALAKQLEDAEKTVALLKQRISTYREGLAQLRAGINSPREICAHMAEGEGPEVQTYRIMAGAAMRELDRIEKEIREGELVIERQL